jgi:hypothetical protein
MKIINILILIIGLLCILLGVMTPLNLFLLVGLGLSLILVSFIILKFLTR